MLCSTDTCIQPGTPMVHLTFGLQGSPSIGPAGCKVKGAIPWRSCCSCSLPPRVPLSVESCVGDRTSEGQLCPPGSRDVGPGRPRPLDPNVRTPPCGNTKPLRWTRRRMSPRTIADFARLSESSGQGNVGEFLVLTAGNASHLAEAPSVTAHPSRHRRRRPCCDASHSETQRICIWWLIGAACFTVVALG